MLFQVEGTQVYLLASMHKLPKESSELCPAIWGVYQQSEVCVFEDNPFEPCTPYPPFINTDGTIPFWKQSNDIISKLSDDLGMFASFGIDSQLLKQANKDGKQLQFLDIENSCNASAFAPLEEQQKMLFLLEHHRDEVVTLLCRLYTAWRKWDTVSLTEGLESQFAMFPVTYSRLITDRNKVWIPMIIKIANSKAKALITVGAFHFLRGDGLYQKAKNHGLNLLEIPINT